jgi:hypothetical protein
MKGLEKLAIKYSKPYSELEEIYSEIKGDGAKENNNAFKYIEFCLIHQLKLDNISEYYKKNNFKFVQ